jgi:CRP/FNR family transcriptional regulator
MEAPRQTLRCSTGHVLFRPEDECRGFLVVKRGAIRVSLTAPNGREIVLYRVRPGEVCLQTFSCLVEGSVYSAEGVVETDLEAEFIPQAEFHRRVAEDSAFRNTVFSAVAHRFADFEHLVEDLALTGFSARLARALLRLAGEDDTLQTTHDQLAAEIGTGRAVVTRTLGRFARDGLIRLTRGRIELAEPDRLRRIADGAA